MTKNEIREEFWNGGLAIQAISHEEAAMIAEVLAGFPGSQCVVRWWEASSSYELEVCKYDQRVSFMHGFGWHVAHGLAVRNVNISELLAGMYHISIKTIDDML